MSFFTTSLQKIRTYTSILGPGLTTGAADDDPSGIATYSQAAAQHGYTSLWLAAYTFPFMGMVQEFCARIGIVTRKGLAANIRAQYGVGTLSVLCVLLFAANTLNIAADLAAMAAATALLFPSLHQLPLIVLFGLFITSLEVHLPYERYARILKYLTLALFSYVLTAFAVDIDWLTALYHVVVPTFSFTSESVLLLCAVLGTTISPYLFFWQTSQEVEERHQLARAEHAPHISDEPALLSKMRVDVWSGMAFSNIVMFFIMLTCAATLHQYGITHITTAETAAQALRPIAGDFAYLLFTLGIVGTGMLAIPILAGSSAYAFAEAYRWRYGLNKTFSEAYAFYGVIIVSICLGIILNGFGFDPMHLLFYAAVVNGIIAPVIIFFIVRIAAHLPRHKTPWWGTIAGYGLFSIMSCVGAGALFALFM
jgi:NRAMP (natural resistance-associated macrophage protein)-like metal ion transporter